MQIHYAARRGDVDAIRRQGGRGVNVDARDDAGETPLMYASASSHSSLATLEFLVGEGADVNAVSKTLERTPLFLAAASGRPEIVRFLLAKGANPRFVNANRYSAVTNVPVHVDEAHLEVLRILLEAGCDPNVISVYGECPLRIALGVGNFQAMRVLLDHGARRDTVGMSELMWAIALGSLAEVRALLERGEDLSSHNVWEMTPMLLAILTGEVDKAECVLEKGARLSDRGRCGRTNLMYAASRDHADMTRWLIKQGADVHATDEFGHSALLEAAGSGAALCAELLLDAGASLEYGDGESVMPAARNEATVRVLMRAGADFNTVGSDGYWLLKSAAEGGDERFADQLLRLGADPNTTSTGETALHTATIHDHLRIVDRLLAQGADPNAADVDGHTPLMYARSLESIDRLLKAGAEVNSKDQANSTVIEHHRDTEILDRLMLAGATIHTDPNSSGGLAHKAAQENDGELLDYLIARHVDLNAANAMGTSPLMEAAERGNVEIMKRLLTLRVDVDRQDEEGRSALFYAAAPEAFTAFQLMREFSREKTRELLREALGERLDEMEKDLGDLVPAPDYGYRPSDDTTAIELLLKAGADLETRDKDGATVLLTTCRCGRPARVKRLLQAGANVGAVDNEGRSPVALADLHHDPAQRDEILKLLKLGANEPIPPAPKGP